MRMMFPANSSTSDAEIVWITSIPVVSVIIRAQKKSVLTIAI